MGIIEEELEGSHYALAINRSLIFYVIYALVIVLVSMLHWVQYGGLQRDVVYLG
jgi:hypothetical protein